MATRSYIAIKEEDNSYQGIYCHWDGYPSGVGATLAEHYKLQDKVKVLISKGSLSSLGPTLKESEFYTDRGEDLRVNTFSDSDELKVYAKESWCEYLYIFEDGKWSTVKI